MNRHIIRDGKEYVRVSDVLQPFTDFSHIPPEVLKNKCTIGTDVHKAIEEYIDDSFPILNRKSIGYFSSFCKWNDQISPKFSQSEQRYFCDVRMLCGQIDTIIQIGKENVLIDFKTSVNESPTWQMQGHLYHYLIKQSKNDISDRVLFIKLNKFGRQPKVFEYIIDKNVTQKCLDAVEEYWIDHAYMINSDNL